MCDNFPAADCVAISNCVRVSDPSGLYFLGTLVIGIVSGGGRTSRPRVHPCLSSSNVFEELPIFMDSMSMGSVRVEDAFCRYERDMETNVAASPLEGQSADVRFHVTSFLRDLRGQRRHHQQCGLVARTLGRGGSCGAH